MITRGAILDQLQNHLPELSKRGIKTLVLFGPHVRNQARPGAEIDFLLELDPPLTFEHYLAVRLYLRDLLKQEVELTMISPLDPAVQPYLDPEAVFILAPKEVLSQLQ